MLYHSVPYVKFDQEAGKYATRQLGLFSLSKKKLMKFVDFGRKLSVGANIK